MAEKSFRPTLTYADEGISGTSLEHRKGMLQLIEDAKAGKIENILAKSIARFARNVVDCLSILDTLRNLKPPVGVHFDENNLYTLDTTGSLVLTILATVTEKESRSKSFLMNWSIDRRFSKGIFLTPKLLGYDLDEKGELMVNPEEAETPVSEWMEQHRDCRTTHRIWKKDQAG